MATVQVCVLGSAPQYLPIPIDGLVHTRVYIFGGERHELQLQVGMYQALSDPFASSSSSSISSSSSAVALGNNRKRRNAHNSHTTGAKKRHRSDNAGTHIIPFHPLSVTVWYVIPSHAEEQQAERAVQSHHRRIIKQVTTSLKNAEKAREALEQEEASNMDDLIAVALEVRTLTLELNKRRAAEQLQYDHKTTTLSCVVHDGQPLQLSDVPGEPELLLFSGVRSESKQAEMVRDVRKKTLSTDVSDAIEGKFHTQIDLDLDPIGMTIHNGLAYVVEEACRNSEYHAVYVIDTVDKKVTRSFPLHGGGGGAGVAVHDQSVYITPLSGYCIQVYALDGKFQRQFDIGVLISRGIAISGDGHIYVCDYGNHRVKVFALDGSHVRSFGTRGTGPGQFSLPTGLAIDEECVYVCDTSNHRVQVFGLDGTFQHMWGSFGSGEGEFNLPIDIIVHGELLYVTDSKNRRIQMFEKETRRFVRSYEGSAPGNFEEPTAMAVSEDGELWLVDSGSIKISV